MATGHDLEGAARLICSGIGFQFGKRVGAGAFKQSFEVTTPDGERRALKVYKLGSVSPRTEREVEAISKCSHPSIVRFHYLATFDVAGTLYTYSLEEFLPGGTLADGLKGGVLPPAKVLELGETLISAVAHIASHGLVHRDLKPDNIMFRGDGQPVIVDFGLVRDLGQSSLTKTWVMQGPGTPYFSAPEQLNNDKQLIDWRTDQFALGLVLGICATGIHAYAPEKATDYEAVEALAARRGPTKRFIDAVGAVGLPVIARMVRAWPVERLRTPEELSTQWRDQKKE